MRNVRWFPLFFILLMLFAFASCKKDSSKPITISLTAVDTAKTVTLAQGQIVKITLGNPGDGGFTFNTWRYDASVLHLNSHTTVPPTNTEVTGDFGSDVWEFSALKSGTSTLKITATQGLAGQTVNMFNDTVKVQ